MSPETASQKRVTSETIVRLRCPNCLAAEIEERHSGEGPAFVQPEALLCRSCQAAFPALMGQPFFAAYGRDDIVRLVEGLAGHKMTLQQLVEAERPKDAGAQDYTQRLYAALERAWLGEDEHSVMESAGFTPKPWWWDYRRTEYHEFRILTHGLDFNGKTVVDVGAGSGSDSLLFHHRGANVIAVEPDFVSLARGIVTRPELHWLGGVAEAVPLASESVDFAVANASLHHHHDISLSLEEMLRMLRCGGWLLTSGDPFKGANAVKVEEDWAQFDSHPGVLRGINEQVLRLEKILDIFSRHEASLEVRVLLHQPEHGTKGSYSLAEARALLAGAPRSWGSMAMAVKKVRSIALPGHRMRSGVFHSSELLDAVSRQSDHLFRFVDLLVTEEHVVHDLCATTQDRWMQLNGWRRMLPDHPQCRLAYVRGKLFLPVSKGPECFVNVEWMAPDCGPDSQVEVEIVVSGTVLRKGTALRGVWTTWSVPVPAELRASSRAHTEIRLLNPVPNEFGPLIPGNHLAVTRLTLDATPVVETTRLSREPSLAALLRTMEKVPACVCSADVDEAVKTLRHVREATGSTSLDIIVASRQAQHYAAIPWLRVVGSTEGSVKDLSSAFYVGYKRQSLPQEEPTALSGGWWLDGEGRPLDVALLHEPTLRGAIFGIPEPKPQPVDPPAPPEPEPVAVQEPTAPPASSKVEELQAKVRELREKADKYRAKAEALKLKLADSKRAVRGWLGRLLRKKR